MFRALCHSFLKLNYPELPVQEGYAAVATILKQKLLRLASKILMLAYALMMFKPAAPIISDALAHTFWKTAHMRVVHKAGGSEHVHYELCKAAKEQSNPKSAAKWKFDTSDDALIVLEMPHSIKKFVFSAPVYGEPIVHLSDVYPPPDLLPPKA